MEAEMQKMRFSHVFLFFLPFLLIGCQKEIKNIERPEKIVSKRNIVYDDETYSKLADLWYEYYNEFPSEDAYANWMYAARYANLPDYKELLENGVSKYPANPTLLYLKAISLKEGMDETESIRLLERAVELDPSFLDPWFGLVVDFMSIGDLKKSENALNKLLIEGAISEEIMDYNYNVLSLLKKDALLITNGDNDTYPAWILTKIIKYRPDITIVNRSLLNTEWYPIHLIKNENVPDFMKENELKMFREKVWTEINEGRYQMPETGPFSDSLLSKIILSVKESQRPAYLASTLYQTGIIKRYWDRGIELGLVTLINSEEQYESLIRSDIKKWLFEFRTAGLSSWKLRYGDDSSVGKWLVLNYGFSIKTMIEPVSKYCPENILPLFYWYKNYILDLLPENKAEEINAAWCQMERFKEIGDWCKNK
jgi:tetratricopeptide (TPR) repeat protein